MLFVLSLFLLEASAAAVGDASSRRLTQTGSALHLPLVAHTKLRRGAQRREIAGLGDFLDVAYSALVKVGDVSIPLLLDTGSSDMWVLSDACSRSCRGDVDAYPQTSFHYSGMDTMMAYGDSKTGTFASGRIGTDSVGLAGLGLPDQYFAAINATDTEVAAMGAAGIFGLGFPVNSAIWDKMFASQHGATLDSTRRSANRSREPRNAASEHSVSFGRKDFPQIKWGDVVSAHRQQRRQTTNPLVNAAFSSYSTIGPFLSRLVEKRALPHPMFSITLQRDTVDIGGNIGMLSIGDLPSGVLNETLTWVPVRGYSYDEGGIPAPPDSPHEASTFWVYPMTWEIYIDDVYLDGEKLPRSKLSSSELRLSALVDTGNSLLRGPQDVVDFISSKIGTGGFFPCGAPHTLSFAIGGKLFPIDPRDFVSQAFLNNVTACTSNIVATDPPHSGGYQFQWSLGTPFLKSVLTSYYYGNLSYPSRDPPRMGFLSTVPENAGELLQQAVSAARLAHDNFPSVAEPAPSKTAFLAPTNSNGIPQATIIGRPRNTAVGLTVIGLGKWAALYSALTLAITTGGFC